jgi:hypothetical protein
VSKANGLPEGEQLSAARLIQSVSNSELEWPLYLFAGGFWPATVLAVVVALRREAPVPALVLLAGDAALFAKSHVPLGPGRDDGVSRRRGLGRAARGERRGAGPATGARNGRECRHDNGDTDLARRNSCARVSSS